MFESSSFRVQQSPFASLPLNATGMPSSNAASLSGTNYALNDPLLQGRSLSSSSAAVSRSRSIPAASELPVSRTPGALVGDFSTPSVMAPPRSRAVPEALPVTRSRIAIVETPDTPSVVAPPRSLSVPVDFPIIRSRIAIVNEPANSITRTTSTLVSASSSTDGSIGGARNLGYLAGTTTITDSVSSTDTSDFFRFSVDTHPNLRLSLTGLSADADVEIIRDGNYNGIVDPGEIIARSTLGGSSPESIELLGLAGTYYARVYSFNGTNNTGYNLTLTTTQGVQDPTQPNSPWFSVAPEPNNTLSQAHYLNTLNGNRNFRGFVSGRGTVDVNDYYRFTIGTTSNFNLVMSGLAEDADVFLIRDSNFNGTVDPGEIINQSTWGSNTREQISNQRLAPGDYYVQVKAYSTSATNYNLFLLANPTA